MTAKSYLGNSLLKASGVPLNFTKDEIEEYLKCADDPIYFIENYCMIDHKDDRHFASYCKLPKILHTQK